MPRIGYRQTPEHIEAGKRFGEKHHSWKGDAISDRGGRMRARQMYTVDSCELCGDQNAEWHHVDGNPRNNDRCNIKSLCRICHMKEDGRLEVVRTRAKLNQEKATTASAERKLERKLTLAMLGWRCREGRGYLSGHSQPGEYNAQAKLTLAQVREIRRLYAMRDTEPITQSKLGQLFGVSGGQISQIIRRASWTDDERTGGVGMSERPFSNGTEYDFFTEANCEHCRKWLQWDDDGEIIDDSSTCEIDLALNDARLGDGTISDEMAQRLGYPALAYHLDGMRFTSWRCPEFTADA